MIHEKFSRTPFEANLNNFVDDMLAEIPLLFKNDMQTANWKKHTPANIIETGNAYRLDLVAPGFEKADFKIKLEQQLLTIEAEKKADAVVEGEKTILKEFTFRSIKRSFNINEKIDAANINAAFANGVLTIILPKKEKETASTQEIIIK